jgi:dihydrofolate reductase
MSQVRVHNFSVSLDGFGTGVGQSMDAPFGHADQRLLEWFLATRAFRSMHGEPGGTTGIDDALARQKLGPHHGPWPSQEGSEQWKGWWGANPPFHTPVFVLTHQPRPAIEMEGGTTFHFIDASPAESLEIARKAAGDLDIRLGGGPSTIRQFLAADLVDHMHVVVVPIILGRGESLWAGLEGLEQRFAVESVSSPSGVTHLTFTRR